MQEAELTYQHTSQPIAYKDLYLRFLACIIGTHIIIVYGEAKSTFEILLTPEYYYAFFGSFIIAFLLFGSVRSIVIKLDKNFDWMEKPVYRIGLQLFFGLIIPGLLAFLMAALYFRIRGINILQTTYLRYDFQFILLQILVINCYYIAYYFYSKWLQAEAIIDRISKRKNETGTTAKETFQVSKGATNILLRLDEIAYCYRKEESNFLRTINGEDFFIPQSLDDVQQQLPEAKFFRANRQLILHKDACKGFDLLTYGKLKASLTPKFNGDVVISQKKSVAFKIWIET